MPGKPRRYLPLVLRCKRHNPKYHHERRAIAVGPHPTLDTLYYPLCALSTNLAPYVVMRPMFCTCFGRGFLHLIRMIYTRFIEGTGGNQPINT